MDPNALPQEAEASAVPQDDESSKIMSSLPDQNLPKAPTKGMDESAAIMARLPDQPGPAEKSVQSVQHLDPERAAKVIPISKATGKPPAYVDQNLDGFQQAQKAPAGSMFRDIEAEYPGTAKFLGDPTNAAVAQNHIQELKDTERVGQAHTAMSILLSHFWGTPEENETPFTNLLNVGLARFGSNVAGYPAYVYNEVFGEKKPDKYGFMEGDEYQQTDTLTDIAHVLKLPSTAPDWLQNNAVKKYFDAQQQMSTAQSDALQDPVVNKYIQALAHRNLAFAGNEDYWKLGKALAAQTIAGLPGLIPLAAGPEIGPLVIAGIQASESNAENVKEGMEGGRAAENARFKGILNGVLMYGGTGSAITGTLKRIAQTGGEDAAKEAATGLVQHMAKSTGMVMSQGAIQSLGNDLVDKVTGKNKDAMVGAGERAVLSAVESAPFGIGIGALGGIHGTDISKVQATTAGFSKMVHQAFGKVAGESKLAKMAPAVQADHAAQVHPGNGYIPIADFDRLFQSDKKTSAESANDLGVAASHAEALATGGHVVLTPEILNELATKQPEVYKALEDHISYFKNDDGTVSPTINQLREQTAAQMAEAEKTVKPGEEQPEEETQGISGDMADKLKTVGQPSSSAALWGRNFGNMAKMAGVKAKDLFQKYNIMLFGPRGEAAGAPRDTRPSMDIRKEAYDNMTPEEQASVYLHDPITGNLNEKAFRMLPPDPEKPMVYKIEFPGGKALNDNLRYAVADDAYRHVGQALMKADPEAAKIGTGFYVRVKDAAQGEAILKQAQAAIPEKMDLDGEVLNGKGMELLGALGENTTQADEALQKAKGQTPNWPKRGELPAKMNVFQGEKGVKAQTAKAPLSDHLKTLEAQIPREQAFREAHTDKDMNIPNRTYWDNIPKKAHASAMDVKKLSELNGKYGKENVDYLFKEMGDIMRHLQKFDDFNDIDIARTGGDEFRAQSNNPKALQDFWLEMARRLQENEHVPDEKGNIQTVHGGLNIRAALGVNDANSDFNLKHAKQFEGRPTAEHPINFRRVERHVGEGAEESGLPKDARSEKRYSNVYTPDDTAGAFGRIGESLPGRQEENVKENRNPLNLLNPKKTKIYLSPKEDGETIRGLLKGLGFKVTDEKSKSNTTPSGIAQKLAQLRKSQSIDRHSDLDKIVEEGAEVPRPDANAEDLVAYLRNFQHDRVFQSANEKNLLIQHNVTAEDILGIEKRGGLAAPSLAITKADQPLNGFGGISLIGDKNLATPKSGMKVFGSDIYSPRYPSIKFKADSKVLDKISEKLKPFFEKTGYKKYLTTQDIEDDGPRGLENVDAVKAAFLDQQGIKWTSKKGKDGKPDAQENGRTLGKILYDKKLVGKFQTFVEKMFSEIAPEERIFMGFDNNGDRRYKAHTLENVVNILKKDLRGGEGFNYGVGSLRAHVSPEFKSVKEIKAESGRLVSNEDFDKVKKEVDEEFFKLSEEMVKHHKSPREFGNADIAIGTMEDAVKMGMDRALTENQYENVPTELKEKIATFLNKLKDLPTEYFEAKAPRAVDLSEFKAAAVPHDTPKKVIDILKSKGLAVDTYKRNDYEHRKQVISGLANKTDSLFQDERGETQFANNDKDINIIFNKNADPSTAIHEGAHVFLRVFKGLALDAKTNTPEIQEMTSILHKWFGIKDWSELTKAHEEQYARGYEQYLREGKSAGLYGKERKLFQRFTDWLVKTYKHALDLNVNVSPEMKGFFDRVTASKEEIDRAALETGFKLEPIKGESPEVTAAKEKIRGQAMEALNKQQMVEVSRKHLEELEKFKAKATKKSTEKVEAMPLFKAESDLGERIGTREAIAKLAKKVSEGKGSDDQEAAFEVANERMGENSFSSGKALAKAIHEASINDTKQALIDKETQKAMEPYQPMKDKANFKEKALEALHHGDMVDMLALEHEALPDLLKKLNQTKSEVKAQEQNAKDEKRVDELKALADKVGELPKQDQKELDDLLAKVKEVQKQTAKINTQAAYARAAEAKRQAKVILDQKTAVDASNWRTYISQARNAAMKFSAALKDKDLQAMQYFKNQEMINRALASEAFKNKSIAQKAFKYLDKLADRGNDLLNMAYGHVRQMDKILELNGLKEKTIEQDGVLRVMAEKMEGEKKSKDEIADATGFFRDKDGAWQQENLPQFLDRVDSNVWRLKELIAPSVMGANAKSPKTMTMGELRELHQAVQAIVYMGRKNDRMFDESIKNGIVQSCADARASIENKVGTPYAEDKKYGVKDANFAKQGAEALLNLPTKGIPMLSNILTICKYLDQGTDGPMHRLVYRIMKHGEDEEVKLHEKYGKDYQDLVDKHYSWLETEKNRFTKLPAFDEYPGRRFTKSEIVNMAANMGNNTNFQRLVDSFHLSREKLRSMVDREMTKKDWDFVQERGDFLKKMWPDIVRQKMEVNGVEPVAVEPTPIQTKFGEYPGWYHPIDYDPAKSSQAFKTDIQRAEEWKSSSPTAGYTQSGFTKTRVKRVMDRPMRLSDDVISNHVRDVIHNQAYQKPVIDVLRVLKNSDMKQALENALGVKGAKSFNDWVQYLGAPEAKQTSGYEKVARYMRTGFIFSKVAFRPIMVPRKYAADTVNVLSELGGGNSALGAAKWATACKDYYLDKKNISDFCKQDPQMAKRMSGNINFDINDITKNLSPAMKKVATFSFVAERLADNNVAPPLYWHVYQANVAEKGPQIARDMAWESVARTLGTGSKLEHVGIQRGDEFHKMLAPAYSFQSAVYNRFWAKYKDAGIQFRAGNHGGAILTVAGAMVQVGLIGGIDGLTLAFFHNAMQPNDEERKKGLIADVATAPFKMVPGVGQIASYVGDKMMGMNWADMHLTPLDTAASILAQPLIDQSNVLFQGGEENEKVAEDISKAFEMTGIYPSLLNTWIFNYLDFLNENGEATWRDLVTRRTKH